MAPKKPTSCVKRPFAGAPRAGKWSAQKQPRPSATAQATPAANRREREFPIVGIGASAGGLEALDELFGHMPNDIGMAFVVITHQHPGHTSLLPELLGKITNLTVRQAADGLEVEPNHVYVSPPGGHLAILGGTLHRMETEKKEAPHLPIDYFFRSRAMDHKDRAICIVLSGMGTDGTLGLKAVKGESGMAMVQQVQSAKYAGMPSRAVATGLADYVLPAAEMPQRLVAYARGPYLSAARFDEAPNALPEPMHKLFVLLRARTGHDFSSYKSNTILRRIERRMNLHQIKRPAHYVRYLQDNPHEIDFLFKELLISVTNFFRDPEAFEALEKSAMPALLKSRPDDYTFRVWVPGCATAELKIKRYTKQARQLIHLIQTDIGRPLAHLASSLAYEKLVDDCREVLRTLAFKLAEVRSKNGRWYLMRIMPYRTAENVMDGVVITFVDINPVKAAEKSLLRMSKVFFDGPEPMILDLSGRITDVNDEAERASGWSRQEIIGQPFQMIVPKSRKNTADDALGRRLAGATVRAVECPSVTKAGRELPGMFTLKMLTDDRGEPDAISIIAKHPVA